VFAEKASISTLTLRYRTDTMTKFVAYYRVSTQKQGRTCAMWSGIMVVSNRHSDRLARSGDNLCLALEHLRIRGISRSVSFQLKGPAGDDLFEFDQLSEGEKQLVAVIGAFYLVDRPDNLVLLDEPDTHLNPQWQRPRDRQRSGRRAKNERLTELIAEE